MFSIIVCSIKPERAKKLHQNIKDTIGVPFEFIAFDNRGTGRGICNVYNECARKAKYDILCFMHEDVSFKTNNWGQIMATQLEQEDCGVIGFAGGSMKLKGLSGWCVDRHDARQNYSQPNEKSEGMKRHYTNPDEVDFSRVICLDGFCQITTRKVWEAAPYDDVLLTGFHGYDLDFSTAAACTKKNYVCNIIDVEHYSIGNYTNDWLYNLKLYHAKWQNTLPLFTGDKPSASKLKKLEQRSESFFIKSLFKNRFGSHRDGLILIGEFWRKNPLYIRAWTMIFKFIKYRFLVTAK